MKKILLLLAILFVSVLTTACINNYAIQELNNKAKMYVDNGETETAICRLKSSLDLDDGVYETHYNLAVIYISIEKYEEAVNEISKVLELKPDFYEALYSLAIAKENIAFKTVDITKEDITQEEAAKFTELIQESIDTYNEYLEKKVDAPETEDINAKIKELNEIIKSLTEKFDFQNSQEEQAAQPLASEE